MKTCTFFTVSLLIICLQETASGIELGDIPFKAESTTKIDSILAQRLQDTLDYVRSSRNVMGVSAAVILPGQVTWTGVSGLSHDTVKISPDMIFGIGSTTKNLTASLVLKLVEEGMLSLDDSLHEWLPT